MQLDDESSLSRTEGVAQAYEASGPHVHGHRLGYGRSPACPHPTGVIRYSSALTKALGFVSQSNLGQITLGCNNDCGAAFSHAKGD